MICVENVSSIIDQRLSIFSMNLIVLTGSLDISKYLFKQKILLSITIRSALQVSIFAPFEKYKVHTSFIRIDVKPCNDLVDLFLHFSHT